MPDSCQVLVIGAGASGLSACRTLSRAGIDVLCVEARNRLGGRILTLEDALAPLPIELGPEFVHGRPPESWQLIQAGGLTVFECAENAVHLVGGVVQDESDSWEQVEAITREMQRLAATGSDMAFSDFIRGADFPQSAKLLATNYVEGFNAARKEEISVASLALDSHAADLISGDRNFRVASGYRSLIDLLKAGSDESCCRWRFGAIVQNLRWSRGKVEVLVRSAFTAQVETITATRVVITLPLGVLQIHAGEAGAVEFSPPLEDVNHALRSLRFGQVMRVVMRFDRPWWEANPELADAGFWLSQEQYFPTWWTTLPVRSSLLVGWSAGPHADALAGKSKEEIVGSALGDLSKISGVSLEELSRMLEAAHFHDWYSDPFARGAYSYVPAGAMGAREVLATPVEDTIFFAGEATETLGHSATVHGAIASGARAARQVLESL